MRGRLAILLVSLAAALRPWSTASADAHELFACTGRQWQRAHALLTRLDSHMRRARPGTTPVTELEAEMAALRSDPCFATLAESGRTPTFTSLTSAQVWWKNGGHAWLEAQAPKQHVAVIPPDVAPSLTLETASANDPLRSLLCSEAEPACGGETRAFRTRAVRAFARHASEEQERAREVDHTPQPECAALARQQAPDARYSYWYACVEGSEPRSDALPEGEFRAPARGWIVLRGRRGHYEFCDELRAYDLATGAAYVGSSCSQLELEDNGKVNLTRTNARRARELSAGRLPLVRLREAAWMTLFSTRVEPRLLRARHVPLPKNIERRWNGDEGFGFAEGQSFWGSSSQTTLSWLWLDQGAVLASGTFRWPDSSSAGESHAAEL